MDELEKQVRRAYRRLGFQRFVGMLAWCWFATLLVALALITVDKFFPLGVEPWGWAAGALGLGLVAAVGWILLTRRNPLHAAIELDHRFRLKERVSSTLAMPPEDRQTEVGRALIGDARRKVSRVDVAAEFGLRPGKSILLPLLPGLAAVLVAVFLSSAQTPAEAKGDAAAVKQQVKKSTNTLRRKLADRRKEAKKHGLKDAEQLFKKLEERTREMARGKTDRKKALVKLNDLARELQQRRKALGGSDRVKKQLNQLKDVNRGPADKFANAIRQGDFKMAADELKKLKDKLNQGGLNEQQKKELAKQLEQMQQKLEQLADAHQNAQKELGKRIEELRQAGQLAEADKLQEQLDKLRMQAPQMDQLKQLANKMGDCAKCLRNGQLKDAAGEIDKLMADVGNLQQQLDEMEMLDEAMQQLGQAKDRMNCKQCGGFG